jgi:hypothetical protein
LCVSQYFKWVYKHFLNKKIDLVLKRALFCGGYFKSDRRIMLLNYGSL